jgi:NAD(P)H-quinone oxidoreductase subunit 5
VLFLFVIMLLGVDRRDDVREPLIGQRIVAAVLALGFVAEVFFAVRAGIGFGRHAAAGFDRVNAGGNTTALAKVLFEKYFFPFEVTSILLIVAVAGKSALLPFSGWLPRAMEGPTPSSAVYYGSLSIHAGCFLLLRAAPLLEHSTAARLLAGGLGAATAIFAGITTRVQSDVKSSLAYAALTQVGIIVGEISIGWYTLAFAHLAGHASFRLLQFLSAPNVLHDLHGMEDAIGERPALAGSYGVESVTSGRVRHRLYLVAIERGFLDSILDRAVVDPFMRLARQLTRVDRWLCDVVIPAQRPALADQREDQDE